MNTMPSARRKQFLLYAKRPHFQRCIAKANARISEFLSLVKRPYVAFSGGKDSHVCLSLVRGQAPDTPAVYFDADCAYPSVETLLEITPNVIVFPAAEPFLDTLKRVGIHHEKLETITMQTTVYEPIKALLTETDYGFDGCVYGLRAEESAARRKHAGQRGAVFQYKDEKIHQNIIQCQPIYDWSYQDVWAFIVSQDIPYCAEYDNLWDLPDKEQRISYWAGESNRNFGRFARLKMNHPQLWTRLVAVCPEVKEFV